MRIIYYKTLCGCIHTRDKLIHGPNSINRRLICPEHGETLRSKLAYCINCGVKIEYETPQSKIPRLCLDCDPIRKQKKINQEKQKLRTRITATEEEFIDVMMARAECMYRPLCFEIYIKKPSLPCFNCLEYKKKSQLYLLPYNINLKELDGFIKKIHQTTIQKQWQLLYGQGQSEWGPIFEKRERDLKKNKKIKGIS